MSNLLPIRNFCVICAGKKYLSYNYETYKKKKKKRNDRKLNLERAKEKMNGVLN